jgi:4-hydroxythreonine-4-phosphate dehydrogenase
VRLVLTPGEPAGIGPDLTVRIAQQHQPFSLIAAADPELLQRRASLLGLKLRCLPLSAAAEFTPAGAIYIADHRMAEIERPGLPSPNNAGYLLDCLRYAAAGCLDGRFQAMVTGPIQKSTINDAGIAFTGHTEFLAQLCDAPEVVMLLATPGLRVALVTTHLPLRQVADQITQDKVRSTLITMHHHLTHDLGIANPALAVCGLNPHAGEGGHLGDEELNIIEPVISRLKSEYGWAIAGPLAADTAFTPDNLRRFDAFVAMYHDQGLTVLKHVGFGRAVNVTLGLPLIRTSVDHGTALSLAGTGLADQGSLEAAIEYALSMATHRYAAKTGNSQ